MKQSDHRLMHVQQEITTRPRTRRVKGRHVPCAGLRAKVGPLLEALDLLSRAALSVEALHAFEASEK